MQEPEAEHHKPFPVPSCDGSNRVGLFISLFKPFSNTKLSQTQHKHTDLGDFGNTGFYNTPNSGPGDQKRRINIIVKLEGRERVSFT